MCTKVIFDTETTGLEIEDRIIQIGSIIYDDEKEKLYDELCYVDIPINKDASRVNGITKEDLENKPYFVDTSFYKDLLELNKDSNYLIAHNINFDLGMLEKEGFKSNFRLIDTCRVARFFLDEDSYSLQDLRYSLNLNDDEESLEREYKTNIKAHNAFSDVVITKLLIQKLIGLVKQKYPQSNPYSVMFDITVTPRFLEVMPFGKYKDKLISDMINETPGYINWLSSLDDLDIDVKYTLKEFKKLAQKDEFKIDLPALKYGPYSYSRIGCFQNCPKAFKYQYIDKIKVAKEDQTPVKAFEKGSYLHSLLEAIFTEINENSYAPILKTLEDLNIFKEKYSDKIEYPENFMEYLEEFDEIFLQFINSEHLKKIIDDFDIYEPEAYCEISLSKELKKDNESLLFRGYIDLKTKKDNHVGIIDWKSGRSNNYDGIQLGNYALSEMLKDESVEKVTVFYALIEQNRNEIFTFVKDSIEEVEKLNNPNIKSIYEIIYWMETNVSKIESETKWDINPKANCYWCDFKNHCEKNIA